MCWYAINEREKTATWVGRRSAVAVHASTDGGRALTEFSKKRETQTPQRMENKDLETKSKTV